MKKFLIMAGIPLLFAVSAVLGGTDFLTRTARTTLAVINPAATVRYIREKQKSLSPAPEQSDGDSTVSVMPHSKTDGYENPFEGFDLNSENSHDTSPPDTDTPYPIAETTYVSSTSSIIYRRQNCYVKNLTSLSASEVEAELLAPLPFSVIKNSTEPQILIMHTHATESYQDHSGLYYDPDYTCRDTDVTRNMVSVGKIIADKLNELGYNTLHDTTLHDYPSYNASYGRSKATVEQYLAQYPSIKIVLDVHRDAIERSDGTRIKPVVNINGRKCAQVMIISGADNGHLNMPDYKKNLRFASHFQNSMETLYPGFTRPVLFDYRNYNQQLTTGSLLIEVGGHANTLEEAHNAAYMIAYSLADMLDKAQ